MTLETASRDGVTPLHTAAEHGSEEPVRLLLGKGIGLVVDAADEEGLIPLHVATRENLKNIVRLLLDSGKAHVNARSKDAGSALDIAFEKGYDGIAFLLLDYGAVKQTGIQQYLLSAEEGMNTPSVVKTIELPYRCHTIPPSASQPSHSAHAADMHLPLVAIPTTPHDRSVTACAPCEEENKAKCDGVSPKCGPCLPPLVSKAGKPHKRSSQACKSCRKRKTKCDEAMLMCSRCEDSSRQCEFTIRSSLNP